MWLRSAIDAAPGLCFLLQGIPPASMRSKSIFLLGSLLLLLSSCFPTSLKRASDIYCEGTRNIQLNNAPQHSFELIYTGCGGMVIHSGNESILVDPFYSNTGLLKLLGKLKTDKNQTDSVFQNIRQKLGGTDKIHNILLAHSHYDHMLDLPYVLNAHLNKNKPQIIGSFSAKNVLTALPLAPYQFREPNLDHVCKCDTIHISERILLYAYRSEHAPHLHLLGFPIQGMKGDIGPEGIKGLDTPDYKSGFQSWKEGTDYSYILELRDPGRKKPFRIFIQSSSCLPPAGIPSNLPAGDSIDLALIGVASTNQVDNYPMQLLSAIRPRYVVLIHWEDFFRAYRKEPKIVRGTRFKIFLNRYQSVMGSGYAGRTSMPRPGTLYRFQY
jgi:hypothetical protein